MTAVRHKSRKRDRKEYSRIRYASLPKAPRTPRAPRNTRFDDPNKVIALDGEGYTVTSGPDKGAHYYTYMSASMSDGLVSEIGDGIAPLRTREIFDWLLFLPKKPRKVIFSGGYDMTKWFEQLPNDVLYLLFRPDQHPGPYGPKPLEAYVDGKLFGVNLLSTKFTLAADRTFATVKGKRVPKWKKRFTMWDLWKFFQSSFVKALDAWDVGTKEERLEIAAMKEKRGNFQIIDEDEKAYCRKETVLLAQLAEKLFGACDEAKIKLKAWYGPGSIAAVMLDQNDAKDQIVPLEKYAAPNYRASTAEIDYYEFVEGVDATSRAARKALAEKVVKIQKRARSMQYAVECAFFGGRFEISRVGPIKVTYSYDIASAYPTAESQLPCLMHGRWKFIRGEDKVLAALKTCSAACVHWSLPMHHEIKTRKRRHDDSFSSDLKTLVTIECCLQDPQVSHRPFGPFPFRLSNGAILFPVTAPGGGWCWHHEFLTARKYPKVWPNVHCTEAWVFVPRCKCKPPYKKDVARAYVRRLEWGKAGKGLVMKLGLNSRYGKRAQSTGSHPYRCLVAAGLITSHTRAAILDSIGRAQDPWDVVSVSTDGILSTRPIKLPKPPKTGTEKAAKKYGKIVEGIFKESSALGEWECDKDEHGKIIPKAIHIIRPGMRFDLGLAKEMKTTAARGLGVKVLHEFRAKVLEAWNAEPMKDLAIQQPSVFHGGKLSVNVHHEKGCAVLEARRALVKEIEDEEPAITPRKKAECSCAPTYHRAPIYGRWLTPDPHKVSYDSLPKRPAIAKDRSLFSWALTAEDGESQAYDRDIARVLNSDLEETQDMADMQPDGGGGALTGVFELIE